MNKQEKKQFLLENLIYVLLWIVIFAAPVFRIHEGETRDWGMITETWVRTLPFFLLFLLNNFLFVPYFLIRRRSWFYVLIVACSLFALIAIEPLAGYEHPLHPERPDRQPPAGQHYGPPAEHGMNPHRPPLMKPGIFGHFPMVMDKCLMALMILGLNIAIKFIFKSMRDDRQLKELEKHALETELNYLKAQINPHFFMNTLNNIHAMVDIDSSLAKKTILELSRMMRYVLYEANSATVSLAKEVEFLKNYIELMRIRYTGQLTLTFTVPERIPDIKIPPLMLITLIENAFKHGVSYQNESFIYADIRIDAHQLVFSVKNSVHATHTPNAESGVGLDNLQKRLRLLHDDRAMLRILPDESSYEVILIIPTAL